MFKQLSFAAATGFAAVMTWQILARMSMDALAMAVGIVLGIGAGLPVALLMLAAERRRGHAYGDARDRSAMHYPAHAATSGYQPPVVVIAPGSQLDQGHHWPLTATQAGAPFPHVERRRRFVVVGQGEGEIEDW